MNTYRVNPEFLIDTDRELRNSLIEKYDTCLINRCNKCKLQRQIVDEVLHKTCSLTGKCNIITEARLYAIIHNKGVANSDTDRIQRAMRRASMLGLNVVVKAPWVILKADKTRQYTIFNTDTLQFDNRRYTYLKIGQTILMGETSDGFVIRNTNSQTNLVENLNNIERHAGNGIGDIYNNVAICDLTDEKNRKFTLFVHSSGNKVVIPYRKDVYVKEGESINYIVLGENKAIKLDDKFNIIRAVDGTFAMSI